MKIAIVQDGPSYLDAEKTFEKTSAFIHEAAGEGCDLIVFGECWFSGYPVWLDICKDVNLWDHPPVKSVWAKTFNSGLSLETKLFKRLQEVIRRSSIYVVIGANEPIFSGPGNGSVYNTIYTFNSDGVLMNHHRKLMPTYTEKLVHGLGDGHGLKTISTPFGRLGSLICWEHWMPLTRQSMHDEGEDIHIALWPYAKELHHVASRHYAHEGRCYTVAVGQVMEAHELPDELEISAFVELDENGMILKGGSAIYGPDGSVIIPPLYNQKKLILAELDIDAALPERMNLSVSGHYNRPDVFKLNVDKKRQ